MSRPENNPQLETIAAQATPPGRGGIGIIRISGPKVKAIAKAVVGKVPLSHYAQKAAFKAHTIIDQGIVIYFAAPNSFTGEDVLELQAHGGAVVLDCLLQRTLELGARLARPGEFSLRAFLNGKIDLTQAEATADLINAASTQAAQCAARSLQGEFANKINALTAKIINLRTQIEAAIDFVEEEVDFISAKKIQRQLDNILTQLSTIQTQAQQGRLLQEGIHVVIAGQPNVGKSSLLNYLTGHDSAIVTSIPGTTRDVLREYININGLPLHIIDTAGLRQGLDQIEQEGIKRAWQEIQKADFVLLMFDTDVIDITEYQHFADKLIIVRNKIDLIKHKPKIINYQGQDVIYISVKTGAGLDLLKKYLTEKVGFSATIEGEFIARRRHLEALTSAGKFLLSSKQHLQAIDLLAEDLRQAQYALDEITGKFYTEDLLDRIFGEFCIGK